MRIAVASEGLDVSKHFSSCTNFNFYKVENNELVDSRNLPSQEHLCGSQANFLRQIEVRVLICGTISERNIEIIPEIDLPGHSRNIASVHPEIRCNYPPDTLSTNGYDGLPSCAVCTA